MFLKVSYGGERMNENKEVLTKVTMTVKEVADYLGISRGTVYSRVKANEIPYVKLGGKILFHRETVDNWLAQLSKGVNINVTSKH